MRIGYARVSTSGQSSDGQVEQLKRADCGRVVQETASGAKTSRAALAALLSALKPGDCLVVTRARPVSSVHHRPADDPEGCRRPQSYIPIPR